MEEKTQRMQQLVRELNEASDAYYNGRQELMTDYEWDKLFDELRLLEQQTGIVLPDSPTQRVSEDTTTGQKEEHEYAALSLAKTKQLPELVKWAEERPIWISWKLDGLTLVVTYDDGGEALQSGDARQRTHRHQHHSPGRGHQWHSQRDSSQGPHGDPRGGRHQLR